MAEKLRADVHTAIWNLRVSKWNTVLSVILKSATARCAAILLRIKWINVRTAGRNYRNDCKNIKLLNQSNLIYKKPYSDGSL